MTSWFHFIKVAVHRGSDRFIFWNTANATEQHPFFCRMWRKNTPTNKPPTTVKPTGKCPDKWKLYNGYCYLANALPTTFSAAQFKCKRSGGALASVSSEEENTFLLSQLTHKKNKWFSTWIGLTNEAIVKGNWCSMGNSAIIPLLWWRFQFPCFWEAPLPLKMFPFTLQI